MSQFNLYEVRNTENSKVYVGITTKTVDARFKEHLWHSRKQAKNYALYAAIRKYGADKFYVVHVASALDWRSMNQLEVDRIAEIGSLAPAGYNLTTGGDAGVQAPETRQAASDLRKGIPLSPENVEGLKRAWADPVIRKSRSEAIREAMRRPEVRLATSARQAGKPKSVDHVISLRKARATTVRCVSTGQAFEAIVDAVTWLRSIGFGKAHHAKILRASKSPSYSAYGLKWEVGHAA